jgi:hypothetical protein
VGGIFVTVLQVILHIPINQEAVQRFLPPENSSFPGKGYSCSVCDTFDLCPLGGLGLSVYNLADAGGLGEPLTYPVRVTTVGTSW